MNAEINTFSVFAETLSMMKQMYCNSNKWRWSVQIVTDSQPKTAWFEAQHPLGTVPHSLDEFS